MNIKQVLLENRNMLKLKPKTKSKKYNLEYWVSGRHESTILRNKSESFCDIKASELKRTDSRYRLGKFITKPV